MIDSRYDYTIEAWSGTKMKFIAYSYTKPNAIKRAMVWTRRLHYDLKVFHGTNLIWQKG